MRSTSLTAVAALAVSSSMAAGAVVGVTGGQTNVALDFDTLESAANLTLAGASGDVINPGAIPDSVAFPINGRGDTPPTTNSYDTADPLGTYSGVIEHIGTLDFDIPGDTITVGDFRIGFDAARAGTLGGLASGFFVESTTGIEAILFDVQTPSALTADETEFSVTANVLVSPEFGAFLFGAGLSTADLAGADVGDARVDGIVPAPGAAALGLFGVAAAARRRR